MAWSLIKPDGSVLDLSAISVAVRAVPGAGMPPVEHITARTGTEEVYQRTLVRPRTLLLTLTARQRAAQLASVQAALLEALNPHLVSQSRPAWLRYTNPHTGRALQMPVLYSGGLQDEAITAEGRAKEAGEPALAVQLISYDPIWQASEQSTHTPAPAVRSSLATAHDVLLRSSGVWAALPALGGVEVLFTASDGTLYAGGSFGGRLATWDGATWSSVSAGGATIGDGTVYAITEQPDGSLCIGGSFTAAHAPADQVVRYMPGATPAWDTSVGSPGVAEVRALHYASDGTLYAGGNDGGSPATPLIRSNDGSGWADTAAFSSGTTITALAELRSGRVIAAGDFSGGVAQWVWPTWSIVGGGLSGGGSFGVYALAVGNDDSLYAGGSFTQAGSTSVSNIARWNGTTWYALAAGPANTVQALAVRPSDGVLFVGGAFSTIGGVAFPGRLAQWNGYTWFALNLNPAAGGITVRALTAADAHLGVAYSGAASAATAAAVTTITNAGTADAYPIITISGPGRVYEVINLTTGDALHLNLVLLASEVLTIDLTPGQRRVYSSFRHNLVNTVIPGSSMAAWRLIPGENRVSLFTDSGTATAAMRWYERSFIAER